MAFVAARVGDFWGWVGADATFRQFETFLTGREIVNRLSVFLDFRMTK